MGITFKQTGEAAAIERQQNFERFPVLKLALGVLVVGCVVAVRKNWSGGKGDELIEWDVAKIGAERIADYPTKASRRVTFLHWTLKGKFKAGDVIALRYVAKGGIRGDGKRYSSSFEYAVATTTEEQNELLK